MYYAFDTLTSNSQSMKTRDRKVADRLIEAKNEAVLTPTVCQAGGDGGEVLRPVCCDPRI